MLKKAVFFLVVLMFSGSVCAQDYNAKVRVDSTNALIGQQINMTFTFESKSKSQILWPTLDDSLETLDIIEDTGVQKKETDSNYIEYRRFVVTSFDTGTFIIQPMKFIYQKEGYDDPLITETRSVELTFNTIAVDTTESIKDIKDPFDAPLTFKEVLPYLLVVLLLTGLGYGIYYFFKNKKVKNIVPEKYDPKIPPHILALESLRKLDERKLWQNDKTKLYYVELTNIIRIYIERRFDIDALEMVTDDIIYSLTSTTTKSDAIESLETMLKKADLVKFAKFQPIAEDNISALEVATRFVEVTKDISKIENIENKS